MGKLYCVCDKADIPVCGTCEKYHKIKPDHTCNHASWKRKIVNFKILELKKSIT